MTVPDTGAYENIAPSLRQYFVHIPFFLRLLCFVMAVLVLARPQTSNHWKDSEVEGIDMMLAIDVSTSMLAEDLRPNRISAAKEVASRFVADCPHDNIGSFYAMSDDNRPHVITQYVQWRDLRSRCRWPY